MPKIIGRRYRRALFWFWKKKDLIREGFWFRWSPSARRGVTEEEDVAADDDTSMAMMNWVAI